MIVREESVEDIIKRLGKEGHIYCYGAGDFGHRFYKDQVFSCLWDYVAEYVDTSSLKIGTAIGFEGEEKKVISLKELESLIGVKDVIIITCKNYIPIIEELNTISTLKEVTCYVYPELKGYLLDLEKLSVFCPDNFRVEKQMLIPKVIHFCWFGKNELNEKHKRCMDSWKKYCSDYDIVRWDESNYDISKNSFMLEAYNSKKWAYVSDYARLDIINTYGGIYLDIDVEIVKSFDELLYQNAFCGYQNEKEINLGLGFGATANNSFVQKIMDEYEQMEFIGEDGNLNLIPCPIIQTNVLEKLGVVIDGQYQCLSNITVYPERVFCGKSQRTRRIYRTDMTYAIHHFDASWMDDVDILHRRNREEQVAIYESYLKDGIRDGI